MRRRVADYPSRECGLPGCSERFVPDRSTARFCGRAHAQLFHRRRWSGYYARRGIDVEHLVRVMSPEARRSMGEAARARGPLSWEKVREIRELSAGGLKLEVLADRFGTTLQNIDLVRNVTWRDEGYEQPRLVCDRPDCGETFLRAKVHQRFCSKRCRETHGCRVASGYYLRHEEAAAARTTAPARRLALKAAGSLDLPLGAGAATRLDVVASGVDVFEEVERRRLAELLAGVDVDGLAEHELVVLRGRLAAAGFRPSVRAA